jgi:hypothetical protein
LAVIEVRKRSRHPDFTFDSAGPFTRPVPDDCATPNTPALIQQAIEIFGHAFYNTAYIVALLFVCSPNLILSNYNSRATSCAEFSLS